MSLILKENETCPHGNTCKYNSKNPSEYCQGTNPKRSKIFICDFVTEFGTIKENEFRSKLDETGKMQILHD